MTQRPSSLGGGGGLSSPVGVADGGTGQTDALSAGKALGLHQGWPTFPYMYPVDLSSDEADAIATPPPDPINGGNLVWDLSAGLDAAAVAAGALDADFDATSTNFAGGPRLTSTIVPAPGKGRGVAAFVSTADLDANTEAGGVVMETGPGVNATGLVVRSSGGAWQVQLLTDGGSVATVNIVEADVISGVWLMLWQEYQSGAGIIIGGRYALGGSAAVYPSLADWRKVHTGPNADAGNATDDLNCGIVGKTANTDDALNVKYGAILVGWVA